MALFQHPGYDRLCADEGTDQIDVHHLAEILHRHLGHGDSLNDAGIVHQNVHAAQLGLNAGDQAADLSLVGDIGNAAVGVDALGGVIGQGLSRLA